MDSDLVRALCALATFAIPLGVAWVVVNLAERRRKRDARGATTRQPQSIKEK